MKKLSLCILLLLIGFIFQNAKAEIDGEGNRIDYFDKDGVRLTSIILDTYSSGNLFSTKIDGDQLLVRGWSFVENVVLMKFVPWGRESYPVTVEVEENVKDNMKVEIEYLDGERTRGGENAVKCGTRLRFKIEVKDGDYPYISVLREYSGISGEQVNWYDSHSLGLRKIGGLFLRSISDCVDIDYRKKYQEEISSTGLFVRDETNKNLWYYDITMPNEPISINFGIKRADDELLESISLSTLLEMYKQYSYGNIPNTNNVGEPYMMSVFGDYISDDMVWNLMYSDSQAYLMDLTGFEKPTYYCSIIPWVNNYYYILKSSLLLDNIEKFNSATEKSKKIARAQMLTLRSHAYWRILQCYGKRWSESDNGKALCAPLETTYASEFKPLASMREILDQCYSDLEEAIGIFSTYDYMRSNIVEPDVNVARGVLMRLALLKEDWPTVITMSKSILSTVPLTNNDQLLSGFFTPQESWIWGEWNNDGGGVYYWDKNTRDSCNGHYCGSWEAGVNAISRDLYDSLHPGDIRRTMFVMPDNFPELADYQLDYWYNSGNVINRKYPLLFSPIELYSFYYDRKPDGVTTPAFRQMGYANGNGPTIPIRLGSQTKFYTPGMELHSDAAVVFMRSDEVLLSLAEAYLRSGDENKAKEELVKLNSMRIPGYTLDATGDDLMKELRITRKIELWGEGHSWFDLKRWNLPIERRLWVAGDTTSGNFPSLYATSVPTDAPGWTFTIPSFVLKTNPLISGASPAAVKTKLNSGKASDVRGKVDPVVTEEMTEESPIEEPEFK